MVIFSKTKSDAKTKTTAIDWAFAGINPLGTDLKVLRQHIVLDSCSLILKMHVSLMS